MQVPRQDRADGRGQENLRLPRRRPAGRPDQNDLHLAGGYSPRGVCQPYEAPPETQAEVKVPSTPIADQLLAVVDDLESEYVINSETGDPHVVVKKGPVTRALRVGGLDCQTWMISSWEAAYPRRAIAEGTIKTVMTMLAARARSKGRSERIHRRAGRGGTHGPVYLDFCDQTGEAVEIDERGWRAAPRAACSRGPAWRCPWRDRRG